MNNNQLDRPATVAVIRRIAAHAGWSPTILDRALAAAGIIPDRRSWRRFLDYLLLAFGACLLVTGIIFFFAYNWNEMHRYAKLCLLEAAVVGAGLIAWQRGLGTLSGKICLFAASGLVGALLAVYGQIYQTGADLYELFLGWAILIAGWVFVSKFPPLWLFLLALLNTAIILFWGQVMYPGEWFASGLYIALFVLNTYSLATWEAFAGEKEEWRHYRWIPRIIAITALIDVCIPTNLAVVDWRPGFHDQLLPFAPLVYLVFAALLFWYYKTRRRDLFMLAIAIFSAIQLFTIFISRFIARNMQLAGITGLFILGLAAGAAFILGKIAKEWKEEA